MKRANISQSDILLRITPLRPQCWTKLHELADAGDTDGVRALLKAGADPNAKTRSQRAPLHLAACRGHVEVIRALVEGGADTEARHKARARTVTTKRSPGACFRLRISQVISVSL